MSNSPRNHRTIRRPIKATKGTVIDYLGEGMAQEKQTIEKIKDYLKTGDISQASQLWKAKRPQQPKLQRWRGNLWEIAQEVRLPVETKQWLSKQAPLIDSLSSLKMVSFLRDIAVFNPDLIEQLSHERRFTYWWVALQTSLGQSKAVDATRISLWERLLAGERKQIKDKGTTLSSIFHNLANLMSEPLAVENYAGVNRVMKKAGIHGWEILGQALKCAQHQLTPKKIEQLLQNLDNQEIAWGTLASYVGSDLILPIKAQMAKQQLNQELFTTRKVKKGLGLQRKRTHL